MLFDEYEEQEIVEIIGKYLLEIEAPKDNRREYVKIFSHESTWRQEKEINTWLKEMKDKIEICRVLCSGAETKNRSLAITIFYKKKRK